MAQEGSCLLGTCKVALKKGGEECVNLERGCTGTRLAQEPLGVSLVRDNKAGSRQACKD